MDRHSDQTALEAFERQAATGTVRGVGTPAISMVDASGADVIPGGGALGLAEMPHMGAVIHEDSILHSL